METSMMSNLAEIEVLKRYYDWASSRMCGDVQRPRFNECLSKERKACRMYCRSEHCEGFLKEMD
jgi:hypothetical protein